MSLSLYLDEHVDASLASNLRSQGVDVLTVQEDGWRGVGDTLLLDRAAELNRVFVTQDKDFLRIAALRQRAGIPFSGVIYAPQGKAPLGRYLADLELIAKACSLKDYLNQVEYLPLP